MSEYICPHCKKPIDDDDALLCLYCGESLNRRRPKIITIVIIVLVLLSFIMLMIR